MKNGELLERLRTGLALCPHEHVAHREEVSKGERAHYQMTCNDDVKFEVVLSYGEDPEPWFARWAARHELDVTKEHLLRVLEGWEEVTEHVQGLKNAKRWETT